MTEDERGEKVNALVGILEQIAAYIKVYGQSDTSDQVAWQDLGNWVSRFKGVMPRRDYQRLETLIARANRLSEELNRKDYQHWEL